MSPLPELLRLRLLLDQCLHPFYDLAADSLTKETEKHLLVALSQVLRQVKQWTHEFGSSKMLLAEIADYSKHLVAATPCLDNRQCLAKIISDLMFLLAINNRYVQNLVGNTLVAISEFVITLDSGWDDFVDLMCSCMKLAISISLTPSPEPVSLETRGSDFDPSPAKFLLKLKSKSPNWSVVAAIFHVLHNIQKYLKKDFNCKTMKAYLKSVSNTIINLSADVLRCMEDAHDTEAPKDSGSDVLKQVGAVQSREVAELFGNFIQFLCSLVILSSFLEEEAGYLPVFCKIIDLVPRLASWCQVERLNLHQIRISHYLRHKVLMCNMQLLMLKLSSNKHLEQTTIITWMHLIHKNFGDLLMRPIYGAKFDEDGFLEGSPFCTSVFTSRDQNFSSLHLQRLTVFLFLKCSINLVTMEGKSYEQQSAKENLKQNCYANENLDAEYQNKTAGSMQLHKWLLAHVPADMLVNGELNIQTSLQFTSSFLRLFIHEDDILFEVLLVLLHVPSHLEHQIIKGKPHREVKNQMLFLASNLFDPIHLFHLFLAEIFYDHQVIVDYLISKDTGSICAEYILRSLRLVCNSLSLFTEFPGVYENPSPSCSKRRKFDANGQSRRNQKPPFLAARDCLISLRTSIDNLNRKKLFPYNPKALVGRLARFEELCAQK